MRVIACPQCKKEAPWADNPFRPFCSERCRLVDLGAWLDEKYTIPGAFADESASQEGDDGDDAGDAAPRSKRDRHGR
jgi:uncharacterized protein